MLVGALAAVLGVGAGIGIALGGSKEPNDPGTVGPGATQSLQTQGPVVSIAPPPTQAPATQSSATQTPNQPTEAPEPTAQQGGTSGAQTIDTNTFSVTVPGAWKIDKQEDTFLSVVTTSGGQFVLESGILKEQVTTAQYLQAVVAIRKEKAPDLQVCEKEADFQLPNGPMGRAIYLCYTFKAASGNEYPAVVFIAASVGTSGGKPVLYYMKIFSSAETWDPVVKEVNPVFSSVQWKLYQGA